MKKLLLSILILSCFVSISYANEIDVKIHKIDRNNSEVCINDKCGVVSKENKTIIPLEYDWIKKLDNENYIVIKNKKYGFFNLKKGEVLPCEYYLISKFDKKHYQITDINNKNGLISKDGNIIIPIGYDAIFKDKSYGYKVVIFDGKAKFGYVENSKLTIPCKYTYIAKLNNDFYVAHKDNWGVLSSKNEVVIPFEYKKIKKFVGDYIILKTEKKSKIINLNQYISNEIQ